MIKVQITHEDKDGNTFELASIRVERLETRFDDEVHSETADYTAQFGVHTAAGFAVYQRYVSHFPRKHLNVLALLRLVLQALEEKELSLDDDPDKPATSADASASRHLARRLGRAMRES